MAWQTPKTDWAAGDGVANGDLNRIEENVRMLSQSAGAFGTCTGSANAYSVTASPPLTALSEGACVAVKINVTNTAGSTINVNGLGAKAIKKGNGLDVAAGQLKADSIYTLRYNGVNFILQGEGGEYGNAQPEHVLSPYTIGTEDGIVTGTMPNRGSKTFTPSDSTQTGDSGYYSGITVNPRPSLSGSASTSDVLSGKTFYGNSYTKQTGTMPNRGSKTFTPTRSTQTGSSGYYSSVTCNPIPSSYYGVGDTITGDKLYMLSPPSGDEVWTFSGHTGVVQAVAVDSSGYVYSGGNDKQVKKVSPSGDEVWTFTGHTNYVNAVAVDSSGYVYSGSNDKRVKKISPSGSEVWTFSGHTSTVLSVAVDNNGYVYSGSIDATVKKISPSGSVVWTFTGHTDRVYAVAVDSSGYVYSGGDDDTVKKISPSGSEVWTFTGHVNTVSAVAADSSGYVYSGSYDKQVKKISSSGSEVWTFTGHTLSVSAVAVDNNGYVYSGSGDVYSGSGDGTVKKISPSGDEVWTFTGHGNAVYAVAVDNNGYVYSGDYDKQVKKIKDVYAVYEIIS